MNEDHKARLKARFHRMISSTPTERGCRAWLGHVRPNGYGTIELCHGGEPSTEMAHRVAYALGVNDLSILRLYSGRGDKRGPVVRHIGPGDGKPCDFKHCVEFSHLAFGSQQENIDDNKIHGTILRGESVGTSHLTSDQIREISIRYHEARRENGGKSVPRGFASKLAREYKTGRSYIWQIAAGKVWTHLQ